MSGVDQEITVASGGAGGDCGGGGEEGPTKESKSVSAFRSGNAGKTLQLLQSRGRKRRKKKTKKKKEKGGLFNSGCCCLCGKQPPVSDYSSGESPCSDPNSKDFTLRVFIEKNDFYSAECNPHLDAADD